jgi:hypothetical protein
MYHPWHSYPAWHGPLQTAAEDETNASAEAQPAARYWQAFVAEIKALTGGSKKKSKVFHSPPRASFI